MAQAIRTADLRLMSQGQMKVFVSRPTKPHPRTVYGTFLNHGRCHFIVEKARRQPILVSYRVWIDDGMLRDLLERSAANKSGVARRGPAVAERGLGSVDESGIPGLVAAAADLRGRKALDGPLVARVKLLEQPEAYDPRCAHCLRTTAEHEHVVDAWTDFLGQTQDAWWCVPTEGSCQVCAAAPGIMCDYRCPNRNERGGKP